MNYSELIPVNFSTWEMTGENRPCFVLFLRYGSEIRDDVFLRSKYSLNLNFYLQPLAINSQYLF